MSRRLPVLSSSTDTGLQTHGNRILFFFCHYKELITPWRGKQREWLASAQPLKWDAFPDFVESEYTVHNRTTADGLKPIRTDRARVPAKPGNSPSASILWTSTEIHKNPRFSWARYAVPLPYNPFETLHRVVRYGLFFSALKDPK